MGGDGSIAAEDYLAREARARMAIDTMLGLGGWVVQDPNRVNLAAGLGVAVREFVLAPGHGRADYLLFVDRKPLGVLEAKPEGTILSNVEPQRDDYAEGMRRPRCPHRAASIHVHVNRHGDAVQERT